MLAWVLLACCMTVASAAAAALRNSTIIRAEELKHSEVGVHAVGWVVLLGGWECACCGVGVGVRAVMVSMQCRGIKCRGC